MSKPRISTLRKRHTELSDWGNHANLVIQNQTFTLKRRGSRKESEWMRDQLAVALSGLIEMYREGK